MKSPSSTAVLKQYAHRVMLAAPNEWEAFVSFFDAYATEVTVAVTAADQSEVLNAQGRAQAFLHLLTTFRNCHVQPQQPPNPPTA